MSAARSSSSSARRSAAGECTDSIASASFGPDAGGADERLERVALVARREAVEHHRVFAHVQVGEEERGVARRAARAARSAGTNARYPTPPTSTSTSPVAVRSITVPRTDPITGRLLRHGAACLRERGGDRVVELRRPSRCVDRARGARAAPATSGTARARARRRRRADRGARPAAGAASPSSAPRTCPRRRRRRPRASPRWGCSGRPGCPARPASASASPLAWPTDIAVRVFTWNSTRSTASATGGNSTISASSSCSRVARRVGSSSLGGVRITP